MPIWKKNQIEKKVCDVYFICPKYWDLKAISKISFNISIRNLFKNANLGYKCIWLSFLWIGYGIILSIFLMQLRTNLYIGRWLSVIPTIFVNIFSKQLYFSITSTGLNGLAKNWKFIYITHHITYPSQKYRTWGNITKNIFCIGTFLSSRATIQIQAIANSSKRIEEYVHESLYINIILVGVLKIKPLKTAHKRPWSSRLIMAHIQ